MELKAHLFVCTHLRQTGESCAAKGSVILRDALKKSCKRPGLRVNASGCLGHCEEGIAAVLYPMGKWFTHLNQQSTEVLSQAIDQAFKELE